MQYEGNVIRPPSEADSIILQVTVGCSHNKCTFCGAYKGITFRIKSEEEIDKDLSFAAQFCKRQNRLFLADGDVLSLSINRLSVLFKKIRTKLPWVNRISLYGNAKNIIHKTNEQLLTLKSMGLSRVYMGVESGHSPTLSNIKKGANKDSLIKAANLVKQAGLFLSTTVLLGIAGKSNSIEHAIDTAHLLTKMAPNQTAILTLMLLPNTPLFLSEKLGNFKLPVEQELLEELKSLVENLGHYKTLLHANHPSNYLSINARLPKDRQLVVKLIDDAIQGSIPLRAETYRAL